PNRAQIAKRTVGHEGVEQSGRLEEVDEERQLPKRRHRRLLVPLDPDRPEKTVQVDPFQPLRHNHRLLTRPVSPRRRRVALHALENARFSPSRQNQTAVSRVNPPLDTVSVPPAALVNTLAPVTFPITVNIPPLLFWIAPSNVPPLAAIVPVLITGAVTVAPLSLVKVALFVSAPAAAPAPAETVPKLSKAVDAPETVTPPAPAFTVPLLRTLPPLTVIEPDAVSAPPLPPIDVLPAV